MAVVADTGGLLALFDATDRHHAAVASFVEGSREELIVPSLILAELDYLLRKHLGLEAGLDLLDNLLSGALTFEPGNLADLARSRALIEQYRGLDLGLADASVVAVAERLGIQRILTVDHRDFRAIRPASGQPLILLPADA